MAIARSTGPIAASAMARWSAHPIAGIPLHPISFVPVQPSLPVAESRDGSLFADRLDSNLHWYLPDLALAPDIDAAFAFAVSQSGQQGNGQPFDVAKLSLTLTKQQPPVVVQFIQANPKAVVREIPLENLGAVLTSSYVDGNGNSRQRTFSASTMQDNGNGSFSLVFDKSILGDLVLPVYQDLRTFGKAAVVVNAGYQCWSQSPPHLMFSAALMSAPLQRSVLMAPRTVTLSRTATAAPASAGGPAGASTPPSPNWMEITSAYSETLPLNLKYNADAYQLRYTIATADTSSRVIIGPGDLGSFNQTQTQFTEFDALGPLGLKYPSLSRAFLGSFSKTLVLIPQRYSILRGKNGCSASCLALIDSSPSSASKCKFEFDFVIAPEVSPIDLARLTADIAGFPEVKGWTFATALQNTPSSTLQCSFAGSTQFTGGTDPYTFAVTVVVQDSEQNGLAVANANLFITRLCAQSGTDLAGALYLMLDEGYPHPVQANIDLNFAHTADLNFVRSPGTDELLPQIDESDGTIKVTNQSPLDLWLQNYALIQGISVSEIAGPALIPAGASVSFPLPPDSAGSTFAYEGQLALPPTMNAAAVTKFLAIQSTDVQSTQYVVALLANVDWTKVASLGCTVTFPTLPAIEPWQTTLTANLQTDSTHIQIPIDNAVFALPALVVVKVNAVDPAATPFTLTLQNDFHAAPTMTVLQSDLVSAPSPAPAPTPASTGTGSS